MRNRPFHLTFSHPMRTSNASLRFACRCAGFGTCKQASRRVILDAHELSISSCPTDCESPYREAKVMPQRSQARPASRLAAPVLMMLTALQHPGTKAALNIYKQPNTSRHDETLTIALTLISRRDTP